MKELYVYDLEQFKNFHSFTGINVKTMEVIQFVIHESRNDLQEYLDFLEQKVSGLIGFNNVGYDYPLLHTLLINPKRFLGLEPNKINEELYQKSQDIINSQNSDNKLDRYKHILYENQMLIPQLDLFKICHFDNIAKRTGLKDIEIAIDFPRVQDLPLHYTSLITKDQIEEILNYNLNDVQATFEFFKKIKDKIDLRIDLTKKYEINFMNSNDPKIGEQIFAKFICQENGVDEKDLKKMRTQRPTINLGECVLPYVKYKSLEFNNLLNKIKNKTIVETKKALNYFVIYKGFRYDFGTGGIHGCIYPGIYTEDRRNLILSCDVTSLYPNLAIQNGFYPKHLGRSFIGIYNNIFLERAKAKKEGNKAVNEGLKLALNGTYGKSNDKFSFFYDPKFTMQITINGQILLTMLAERLQDEGFKMLMINTDGMECIVPIEKKDKYFEICSQWERETKLQLEFAEYKKLVIRDVNNYIGIYTNEKVKYKGTFELEKDFHKNCSFRIVQIALSEYFVKGIPIEDTIKNHTNIYDFCGRHKTNKDCYSEIRYLGKDKYDNPILIKERQQKTTRYYISQKGATYYRIYTGGKSDGGEEVIEKDRLVTIFNNYIEKPFEEYNIDYDYFIKEANKIIRVIEKEQLSLF